MAASCTIILFETESDMSQKKTAVVTGSSSGIGLGIARGLAATGMNIVLNGIEPEDQIDPIRREIEADFGIKARYDRANLMEPAGVRDLMAGADERFGSVDVLVNNAGIQFVSPVEEFPDEKWQAIINLNLSAAFYAIKAAVPGMKERGWGRIINIASAHGLVASPYKSAYVAAKHGIVGLTKTIALEVAEHGVTVNAICPGYVWTPLVEKQIPDTAKARGMSEEQVIRDVLLAGQPTKKFATVEEMAALTVFLTTDGAASITGTALPVDGGWTAH
jgi:3-hydroxybutyrate dehydrogenase